MQQRDCELIITSAPPVSFFVHNRYSWSPLRLHHLVRERTQFIFFCRVSLSSVWFAEIQCKGSITGLKGHSFESCHVRFSAQQRYPYHLGAIFQNTPLKWDIILIIFKAQEKSLERSTQVEWKTVFSTFSNVWSWRRADGCIKQLQTFCVSGALDAHSGTDSDLTYLVSSES